MVNFVGTDSPNFDFPQDQPVRYDYLIGPKKLKSVEKTYGKDSLEWCSQCEGVMRPGLVGKRVITREMCRLHHAHDEPVWAGTKRTRIYACDPAYGGGDRCVGGWIEFGPGIDGRDLLYVYEPEIIPVSVKIDKEPSDQIAEHIKMRLDESEVPAECCGYDSFGGGQLGLAFAQVFGYSPPVPIDSGSRPTKRPVRYDLFVNLDGSPWTGGPGEKRLKRCDEEYSKFVTEMWFSVAEIIKGNQMRGLPQEVMLEGCLREYRTVLGNKTEVESKEDTKARMGKSPDLFDWCFEADTLVDTIAGPVRIDSIKEGDLVLTPFGSSKVIRTSVREVDSITEAKFSNGATLKGVGSHKIFTWDQGWVSLDSLSLTNELESSKTLPLWQLANTCFTKTTGTGFKAMVDIIHETGGGAERSDFYIGLSGLSITGRFLRVGAFIIKTLIGETTGSRIWTSCLNAITQSCTSKPELELQITCKNSCTGDSLPGLRSPLNGTNPRLEGSGTAAMLSVSGEFSGSQCYVNVMNVGRFLKLIFPLGKFIFAQVDAKIGRVGETLDRLLELARCAIKALWLTVTVRRPIVPVTVQQLRLRESKLVYNLRLEEHNAYYANGILVANCAIGVEMARRKGFRILRLGVDQPSATTVAEEDNKYDEQQSILQSKMLRRAA